jgi:hypothetical protein
MWSGFGTIRDRSERAWERAHGWARVLISQLRPRVSLASGSALVLLTLFLPIGVDSCGGPHKGYELIRGEADWPSLLGLTCSATGRGFYAACLLLAALTLLLILLSLFRAQTLRGRSLVVGLFRWAGTMSLLLISDIWLMLARLTESWIMVPAYALVALACLSPFLFWPRRLFIIWLSIIVSCFSLFFIIAPVDERDLTSKVILHLLIGVLAATPLAIWYRYTLSRCAAARAQWPRVRSGLVAFYALAVAGNCWMLVFAVQIGIWGLLPCWFGVHLTAVGYMKLAARAEIPAPSPA